MKTKSFKKLKIPDLNYDKFKIILISASKFPDDNSIVDVPNIDNNITALQRILTDSKFVGIPSENISVVANPNKVDFEKKLKDFADNTDADDTLFVYYTGHGLLDSNSLDVYFATKQSDTNHVEATSVSVQRFRNIISNAPAKRKIIFIDACFSGKIISTASNAGLYEDYDNFEGEFIISSSSEYNQSFYPADSKNKPTYFTNAFINILTSGVNIDKKYLTLNDIYTQIYNNLKSADLPVPQISSFNNIGNMPIVVNKAYSDGNVKKALNLLNISKSDKIQYNPVRIYKGNSILNIILSITVVFVLASIFYVNRINTVAYKCVNYSYTVKNVRTVIVHKNNIASETEDVNISDLFDKIEIFQKADNNTDAIIYYLNQILSIDPSNTKAQAMLDSIQKN